MDLQSQLVQLSLLIEQFEAMENPAAAQLLWNTQIAPLLAAIASAEGIGRKVVLEYVYRQIGLAISALATDAEMAALSALLARRNMGVFIQRMMARAAVAGLGPQDAVPPLALLLVGMSLITTAREASAATNEVPEYTAYMKRYMEYALKNTMVHRGTSRLPPPATFTQWMKRNKSGAWWQF